MRNNFSEFGSFIKFTEVVELRLSFIGKANKNVKGGSKYSLNQITTKLDWRRKNNFKKFIELFVC